MGFYGLFFEDDRESGNENKVKNRGPLFLKRVVFSPLPCSLIPESHKNQEEKSRGPPERMLSHLQKSLRRRLASKGYKKKMI